MRIVVKLVSLLLFFVLAVSVAQAGPRANPKKGKVYYKKHCRVCHDGSKEAPTLEPITKTMEQWGREFAPKGIVLAACHKRVTDEVGVKLTDQDLLDIQSYLVQHAADSDQPATCGN